eukprot:9195095-Pyramimonas_sp.AAC.1
MSPSNSAHTRYFYSSNLRHQSSSCPHPIFLFLPDSSSLPSPAIPPSLGAPSSSCPRPYYPPHPPPPHPHQHPHHPSLYPPHPPPPLPPPPPPHPPPPHPPPPPSPDVQHVASGTSPLSGVQNTLCVEIVERASRFRVLDGARTVVNQLSDIITDAKPP